jgi:hypothetical protein
MTPRFLPLLATNLFVAFLSFCQSAVQADTNLIRNPGFEEESASWGMFVPQESENKGCEFLISQDSPHSGSACAEMKSGNFARFSIGQKGVQGDPIRPGDRCRLTFWIRAAQGAQTKGNPAFIVRIFLLDEQKQQLPGNLALFVGLNGHTTVQSPETKLDFSMFHDPLPTKWTKVESVFEIPASTGATRLNSPEFFALYTMGSVFLDDVSLERVEKTVPLSPSDEKR